MYQNIFNIGNIIFYIAISIGLLLLVQKIIYHVFGLLPSKQFPNAKKEHRFAILIPARNESAVIEGLLNSIKAQTFNKDNFKTFVIVESADDPTCEIVKNHENTEIFLRTNLENKGKGYALDECIKYIFSSDDNYEAFMVCDADNVLDEHFMEEMNKSLDAGYKLCLGYRNSKNWNDGWIASCSALTFSMINTFQNKSRARFDRNVVVSGTGFYIASDVLKEAGGYPFYTLTEDYELSTYSALNNVKSTYNEYAEYYDEQPTTLKASCKQRLRWCKGYDQVNKKYRKQLRKSIVSNRENRLRKIEYCYSILPVMVLTASAIIYELFTLTMGIIGSVTGSPYVWQVWRAFLVVIAVIYSFFVLYSMFILIAEKKHTNITTPHAVACCLMSPFYWALYVPIFTIALFKPTVEWTPIIHSVNMEKTDK